MKRSLVMWLAMVALIGSMSVGCRSKEQPGSDSGGGTPDHSSTDAPPAASPAATTGSPRATLPAETVKPEPPPAPLAISLHLAGEDFYGGDPLPITVLLVSPLARAQAYRPSPGDAASAPVIEWPTIPPEWAESVTFVLHKVQADGSRQPVSPALDWAGFLLPAEGSTLGNPSRTWRVSADALPHGSYVLEAVWNGKGLADASKLPADGALRAELEFELIEARTNPQKAVHLYHVADGLYRRNEFTKARDLGRKARELFGGQMTNTRIANLEMVADCSTGLCDLDSAIQEYREVVSLLAKGSPRAAECQRRIKSLSELMAKEKTPRK